MNVIKKYLIGSWEGQKNMRAYLLETDNGIGPEIGPVQIVIDDEETVIDYDILMELSKKAKMVCENYYMEKRELKLLRQWNMAEPVTYPPFYSNGTAVDINAGDVLA